MGLNPALFPSNRDEFRPWKGTVDDMIAEDLADMFAVAIAIETELGVEPSGKMGTVYARLWARGNLSKIGGRNGNWRRMQSERVGNLTGLQFNDELEFGFTRSFDKARFANHTNEWGQDVPLVFAALQGPIGGSRKGIPWNIVVQEVDADIPRMGCWGLDGGNGSAVTINRLETGNSQSGVAVGFVYWGMR